MGKAALVDSELLEGQALGITYQREDKTENYVEVPPALLITDADGATWTLGMKMKIVGGRFEFNVLRNDVDLGVFAEKIVYEKRKVFVYGHQGKFMWTGRHLF